MAKKRLLFIGNADIRFAVGTPYIPVPGETIPSDANYTFAPGGRTALSAIAAARLGYDSVLCARVGDDYYGDRLMEVFKKEGLHVANVTVQRNCQTGLCLDLVEMDGTCRSIYFPGANRTLDHTYAEGAMGSYPDAIVVSLETDPQTVIKVSQLARERGIPFFLDGCTKKEAVPKDFPLESVECTTLMVINEEDAKLYSGIDPVNEEKRKLACYTIRKRFDVQYIVLQLGIPGCFIYDGKYFSAISSCDAEETDRAGASEAFSAAMIGEYMRTNDLRKAAEFATNVYAKAVSAPGGYHSLPTREQITE